MTNTRKLRYVHVSDKPGADTVEERVMEVTMDELGNDTSSPVDDVLKFLGVDKDEESTVVDVSSDEFGDNVMMIINKKYQEDLGGSYNFTLWRMLPIFGDCVFIEVGVISDTETTMVDMNDSSLYRIKSSIAKYKTLEKDRGIWLERITEVKTKGKKRFIEDYNKKIQEEIAKIQEGGVIDVDSNRTSE